MKFTSYLTNTYIVLQSRNYGDVIVFSVVDSAMAYVNTL